MPFCSYYRAYVVKKKTCLFVAILRSYEHIAFDRTLDKQTGLFEFFVPQECEEIFVDVMHQLSSAGMVSDPEKIPNRLIDPQAQV